MSVGATGTVWTVLGGAGLLSLIAMALGFVLSLIAVLQLVKRSGKDADDSARGDRGPA